MFKVRKKRELKMENEIVASFFLTFNFINQKMQ